MTYYIRSIICNYINWMSQGDQSSQYWSEITLFDLSAAENLQNSQVRYILFYIKYFLCVALRWSLFICKEVFDLGYRPWVASSDHELYLFILAEIKLMSLFLGEHEEHLCCVASWPENNHQLLLLQATLLIPRRQRGHLFIKHIGDRQHVVIEENLEEIVQDYHDKFLHHC